MELIWVLPYSFILDAHGRTELDITIFPNPVADRLNLVVTSMLPTTASLHLTNISGSVFYPANRELIAGKNAFSIDVSMLAPGIYTLCVRTGNATNVKKWVKL